MPNEIPIAWEQLSDTTATVQIKFEDDGSLQRVFRRTFIAGHYQFENLYLGPEGKDVLDEATSNLHAGLDHFFAMEPAHLFDLKWHGSVRITKTVSHIYVVTWDTAEERAEDQPPLGTTFYLIKASHLVPVCTFQPPKKNRVEKALVARKGYLLKPTHYYGFLSCWPSATVERRGSTKPGLKVKGSLFFRRTPRYTPQYEYPKSRREMGADAVGD